MCVVIAEVRREGLPVSEWRIEKGGVLRQLASRGMVMEVCLAS